MFIKWVSGTRNSKKESGVELNCRVPANVGVGTGLFHYFDVDVFQHFVDAPMLLKWKEQQVCLFQVQLPVSRQKIIGVFFWVCFTSFLKFDMAPFIFHPVLDLLIKPCFNLLNRSMEAALRSYAGDDPLDPWDQYIKWTEQAYPNGGKDSNLQILLEKCLAAFKTELRYKNDVRYVSCWIKLVSMSKLVSFEQDTIKYWYLQGLKSVFKGSRQI